SRRGALARRRPSESEAQARDETQGNLSEHVVAAQRPPIVRSSEPPPGAPSRRTGPKGAPSAAAAVAFALSATARAPDDTPNRKWFLHARNGFAYRLRHRFEHEARADAHLGREQEVGAGAVVPRALEVECVTRFDYERLAGLPRDPRRVVG